MKHRVVMIAIAAGMVLATSTAVGAAEGGWFESIDALESAADDANTQAQTLQHQSEGLDEHLATTLGDAGTAKRVIRDLRRDVALEVVRWDAGMRRAERAQWMEGPDASQALHRVMEASELPATEAWIDKVNLLAEVFEGIEHADALLVRSAELQVFRAQLLGEAKKAEAEREQVVELAGNDDARAEIDDEQEELAEALSRELERLETDPSDDDFHRNKGALLPPVSAEPEHPFGPRRRSDSYTKVRHTGVTYMIDEGTSVRSVAAGTVVEADRFPGYGKLVIIDHGDEHHSIYAHLESFAVEIGDEINARDVIGSSGQSGSLEGPKLYFELRRQGRPVDPQEWFVSQ